MRKNKTHIAEWQVKTYSKGMQDRFRVVLCGKDIRSSRFVMKTQASYMNIDNLCKTCYKKAFPIVPQEA